MAKSSAQKKREKLIREGRRDPMENRSIYAKADLRMRKTKTKVELLNQKKHKGRLSPSYYDEDNRPFYLFT